MRLPIVLTILGMAAVTYASRVGLIGVARQFELHPLLRRALEYVPVTILSALIFPAVLAPDAKLANPLNNVYLWAALLTAGVLVATKKPVVAIVLGVASLVVMRRLLGA